MLYKTSDVARALNISQSKVRKMVKAGELKPVRIGKCVRFNVDQIQDITIGKCDEVKK
jgi:excisionase family DNA binding protein